MRRQKAAPFALGLAAVAAATGSAAAALTWQAFRRDMDRARKRITTGCRLVTTRCGPIEYSSVGEGVPLLIIHGAGGGFDQLRAFESDAHLSELGFRLIFVSRFGYLGTPLPKDASTRAQADAYAALLDVLGIEERVGVIAVSAGGPSGLEFAARYPHRCEALALLVPAAFTPDGPVQAPAVSSLMGFLRDKLLGSNFAFWLMAKLGSGMLTETILGTPLDVVKHASAAEQQRIHRVLMDIFPVSNRRDGLLNDAAVVSHLEPAGLAHIRVPTLVVSAEDDLYGTSRSARYLSQQIPGARLVMYPNGGHLWVGHNDDLERELKSFLLPLIAERSAVTSGR